MNEASSGCGEGNTLGFGHGHGQWVVLDKISLEIPLLVAVGVEER
jgi:hypothetical protein